jgi:hypothetical protein
MEGTLEQTMRAIAEARDIMESFDNSSAMTIEYEGSYMLTAEQMTKIAGALYLADCELYQKELQNEQ